MYKKGDALKKAGTADFSEPHGNKNYATKPIFYCWLDLASTYFIKAGLLYLKLQYCIKSVKSTRHNWLHFITD